MLTRKVRTPITWFGGKGQLVGKLVEYVPPHKYYVEPFGGGASLLFAKKPSGFEVYNDLDEGLFNFFRVLRDKDKFKEFYRKVCLTPQSRNEYEFCRKTWQNEADEVERAYRWYIVARMSFGGSFGGGWGFNVKALTRNMSGAVSGWLSIIDLLPEIHERVMRVQIENKDFRDIFKLYIERWSYKDSFAYLDPPYVPYTRREGGYAHEMSIEDHRELVELLLSHEENCKYMVSGYENEIYEKLEKNGWKKVTWDVPCNAVGKTYLAGIVGEGATFSKKQRRKECIWMNYDIRKGDCSHG